MSKLIMRNISTSFYEVDYQIFTIPYKEKSAKYLRNALSKPLRKAYEKVVYDKFQVYSLQI